MVDGPKMGGVTSNFILFSLGFLALPSSSDNFTYAPWVTLALIFANKYET